MSHWSSPLASSSRERSSSHTATPWADSSASGSWRVLLVMFGPSGSGRVVGGAVGGRGKGGRVPSWPGAVLAGCRAGRRDAVSCRGDGDADLAAQGLVVSGGAVTSGTGAVSTGIVRVRGHYLLSTVRAPRVQKPAVLSPALRARPAAALYCLVMCILHNARIQIRNQRPVGPRPLIVRDERWRIALPVRR